MINKSYKKEIQEIKDQEWVLKVYKENLDGLVGYFIQFIDGSFLHGVIEKSTFKYNIVKDFSYLGAESHMKRFMNYMNVTFDGKPRHSFMKALHSSFDAKQDKSIQKMTKAELEAEMLLAAKQEDFVRAAMLKKKLEEK